MTASSNSLTETALAFAREVMGWEGAEQTAPSHIWNGLCRDESKGFAASDLNAILAAVKGWCKETDSSIERSYYGYDSDEWEASACSAISMETVRHANPCHAIMSACLEAQRRLKAE